MLEGTALLPRLYRAFGRLRERGPPDGPRLMVLPGFLATDRTTLGLQRALAGAGYRVSGWGLGMNKGVRPDTLQRISAQLERFGKGEPVILVGWSLGGIYAREVAKVRPDLAAAVVTLGTPFSGDRRNNNVWRLYEFVARHPVDRPPVGGDPSMKPPVPTLALWSRRDGLIAPSSARGEAGERDGEQELDCRHMGYAVSGRAFPAIVRAIADFSGGTAAGKSDPLETSVLNG